MTFISLNFQAFRANPMRICCHGCNAILKSYDTFFLMLGRNLVETRKPSCRPFWSLEQTICFTSLDNASHGWPDNGNYTSSNVRRNSPSGITFLCANKLLCIVTNCPSV